jgi:hypothetical protein
MKSLTHSQYTTYNNIYVFAPMADNRRHRGHRPGCQVRRHGDHEVSHLTHNFQVCRAELLKPLINAVADTVGLWKMEQSSTAATASNSQSTPARYRTAADARRQCDHHPSAVHLRRLLRPATAIAHEAAHSMRRMPRSMVANGRTPHKPRRRPAIAAAYTHTPSRARPLRCRPSGVGRSSRAGTRASRACARGGRGSSSSPQSTPTPPTAPRPHARRTRRAAPRRGRWCDERRRGAVRDVAVRRTACRSHGVVGRIAQEECVPAPWRVAHRDAGAGRLRSTGGGRLGYGRKGSPPEIGPDATLLFRVTLVAIASR